MGPTAAQPDNVRRPDGAEGVEEAHTFGGGDGAPAGLTVAGAGTGLARLRERLTVLYGTAAWLSSGPAADGGFEAVLVLPRDRQGSVKVSTFIVDDEPVAHTRLRAKPGAFDWVEVMVEAADGESACRGSRPTATT